VSEQATSCPQSVTGHEFGRPMWHTYAREFGRMCTRCGQLKEHPWFQSDPPENEQNRRTQRQERRDE
jgi:hypothetical protein